MPGHHARVSDTCGEGGRERRENGLIFKILNVKLTLGCAGRGKPRGAKLRVFCVHVCPERRRYCSAWGQVSDELSSASDRP